MRSAVDQKKFTALDHPPYFPELAPCDFWLFRKLKCDERTRLFVLWWNEEHIEEGAVAPPVKGVFEMLPGMAETEEEVY